MLIMMLVLVIMKGKDIDKDDADDRIEMMFRMIPENPILRPNNISPPTQIYTVEIMGMLMIEIIVTVMIKVMKVAIIVITIVYIHTDTYLVLGHKKITSILDEPTLQEI